MQHDGFRRTRTRLTAFLLLPRTLVCAGFSRRSAGWPWTCAHCSPSVSCSVVRSPLCCCSLLLLQSNENISPAVVMKVAKELRQLSQEPLDGIKVLMNDEDITDVNAEIGPGERR